MRLTLVVTAMCMMGGCSIAARSPEMYRDETSATLATKNDEIRACYDALLKTSPSASGRVAVHFDVPKDGEENAGRVSNVQVDPSNTTAPQPVADCVTKTITGAGPLSPPDQRNGNATFVYEFAAPPPPVAPAPRVHMGRAS